MVSRTFSDWLKAHWLWLIVVVAVIIFTISTICNWWASYQCVEAGFLGGTIYNFHVVCFVSWP